MKYITGEVGDLNDWNMAEGFYNNLVAKAASSAISKTIKNQIIREIIMEIWLVQIKFAFD